MRQRWWYYRWQLGLALATLCLSWTAPARAVMTVETYLAISRGEVEGVESESLIPYLVGVLDAALLMADIAAQGGAPIFCVPPAEGADLDVYDVQQALDDMLAELEESLDNFRALASDRSVGLATIQLLTDAFPCGGSLGGL